MMREGGRFVIKGDPSAILKGMTRKRKIGG